MFERLKERAESFLAQNQPAIDALGRLDVSFDDAMVKTSNIVVTYPPKQVLEDRTTENFHLPSTDKPKALYIHIPFCTGICNYCAFERTANSAGDPQIAKYVDLLSSESKLVRQSMGGKRIPVESIYIGGGTPTLLPPEQLEKLFDIIARDYELRAGSEYTLEGSPETLIEDGTEKLKLAQQYSVNRVSIGIESFDDPTLKALNRRHDAEMAERVIHIIKNAGINNIDIDLIRGLPQSSADHIINNLQKAAQRGTV